VKKYIREREQYGECNILPELAAAEVVKCVQYMWMEIEVFEELLCMVEHWFSENQELQERD